MLLPLRSRTYRHLFAAQVIALLGTGLATVALDLVRAAIAICLPFVEAIWQVCMLVFVLQAASAAFTPTFQATWSAPPWRRRFRPSSAFTGCSPAPPWASWRRPRWSALSCCPAPNRPNRAASARLRVFTRWID